MGWSVNLWNNGNKLVSLPVSYCLDSNSSHLLLLLPVVSSASTVHTAAGSLLCSIIQWLLVACRTKPKSLQWSIAATWLSWGTMSGPLCLTPDTQSLWAWLLSLCQGTFRCCCWESSSCPSRDLLLLTHRCSVLRPSYQLKCYFLQ